MAEGTARTWTVTRLVLAALVLSPALFLGGFVLSIRSTFGIRSPATWSASALFLLAPVVTAILCTRADAATTRSRLMNALAVAASCLFTLGAVEIAVRATGFDPAGHEVWRRQIGEPPTVRPGRDGATYSTIPHAEWGHMYSSNERGYFDGANMVHYRANSAGFRGPDLSASKPPHTLRIAILGDSFAFGEGVKDDDVAARRIERRLNERSACAIEVLNFGTPGYDTVDEAKLVEHPVMDARPDIVVVWYFLNDAEAVGTMGYLTGYQKAQFLPWYREFSALARLIGSRLDMNASGSHLVGDYLRAYRDDSRGFAGVKEGLARISEVAHRSGARVALFVHPILYRLDDRYPFAGIHAKVLAAARGAGMEAFDLFDAFRGRDGVSLWVHPSDQHPNEEAHRIAAEFAAERLLPLLPSCP